jgi:hypothetical protein
MRLLAVIALISVLLGLTAVSMAYNPPHFHDPAGNCVQGMHFSESEGMCH